MAKEGYATTAALDQADLVLVNTCSIREKAEQTVRKRLEKFNAVKQSNPQMKVGVLGCMAERLKHQFLEEEKIVDMVVGPDAYKDLPNLLAEVDHGREAVNVILSKEETYGDISRTIAPGVSGVTITRGCDNMCTFCVCPLPADRTQSRPQALPKKLPISPKKAESALLGQNVDSYLWYGGGLKKDFDKASAHNKKPPLTAQLLRMVAAAHQKCGFGFPPPTPDMTTDVLHAMAAHDNICKYIHLPVQSGSNRILKKMNRLHTREEYFALIDNIRRIIPNCAISQDMIAGFPTETEEDHQDTLALMDYVKYDFGFMFAYSERPAPWPKGKWKTYPRRH